MIKRMLFGNGFDAILGILARTRILGPVTVAKLKYFQMLRRWPDFKHPKDINEKINWLKFNGDTSSWPALADKYAVMDYVREKGYGDNLVGLIGKWDRAEDIDWDSLPDRFVMKCNNRSGDALICKDKSQLDGEAVKARFARFLKKRYGMETSELHYNKIKPCVIAVELLDTSTQPGGSSLVDYKIWCFAGKPEWVICYSERTPTTYRLSVFDTEWNSHPEFIVGSQYHTQPSVPIARPDNLEEMLAMAASLSEGFPVVRIDLYNVDGKVYFGEITFTAGGGYLKDYNREFLRLAGDKIQIDSLLESAEKARKYRGIRRILQKHQTCKEITRLRDRSLPVRFYAGTMASLSGLRLFMRYKLFRPPLPDPLPSDSEVIMSLTSFPKRMKHLWMVIDLLMRQDTRPSEIILCLFKGDFPDRKLPESLDPYLERGLRVIWADENLKPHLKYYYTFQEELSGRGRLVVTVDDDIYYPLDTVSRLMGIHREYPDAVCANIARRVEGPHYVEWAFERGRHAPDPELIALGFGGVLYPASFYRTEALFDLGPIREICLKADDLWLKRCETNAGVDVATGDFFAVPPSIPSSQAISLSMSNVGQGQNDVIWAGLERYFDEKGLSDR